MGDQNNTSITDGEIMRTEGRKKGTKQNKTQQRGISKKTNKQKRGRERERDLID